MQWIYKSKRDPEKTNSFGELIALDWETYTKLQ